MVKHAYQTRQQPAARRAARPRRSEEEGLPTEAGLQRAQEYQNSGRRGGARPDTVGTAARARQNAQENPESTEEWAEVDRQIRTKRLQVIGARIRTGKPV